LSSQKIIGQSKEFKNIIDDIRNIIAQTSSTVMITGESGTGKEVIARYIHEASDRSKKPFIAVNISSLAESLIESELFGSVKGSFTGSIKDKIGYLESANNGTLFLDEIGELPMNLQVKILRFIQEGEVIPIGSTQPIKVDVRIIAATNKDLNALIKEGLFREDLYYRLNVIPLHLPPLRERIEDISLLSKYFLEKYSVKYNRNEMSVDNEVMELLSNYDWPGNVRELENVIERLVVYNKKLVTKNSLPQNITNTAISNDNNTVKIKIGTMTLQEVEDIIIKKTLDLTDGDKKLAAKILDVSLRTIYRKT
jgi:transcriptional regulator with PAS, ATPase and Fis domain